MKCQHVNICPFRSMRPPSDDGLFRFEMRSRQFKQTVAQPWQGAREPQTPARTLGAGETVYRPFSWRHDVAAQLAFAGVYGVFVLVAAGAFTRLPWPAWLVVVVVDGVVCAVFTVLEWDVWQGAIERYITQERQGENAPAPEVKMWNVRGEMTNGKRTLYDEFGITNAWAWHRFCKAVHVDGKNFSQSESKNHKVPRSDWNAVTENWKHRGWFVPAARRGTPGLRQSGPAWVRAYATTPPPMEE